MTGDRSDPYAVLGLPPTATREQVRRAYRTLLRQNHPDTRPHGDATDNATSNTTLQQAIAAYAALGDPARRVRHDDRATPAQTTPTPARPAWRSWHADPEQPPIQAGPVHWRPSR
jgi:curved DNA-binding protein CbpA